MNLLLTDVIMPDMDGKTLFWKISLIHGKSMSLLLAIIAAVVAVLYINIDARASAPIRIVVLAHEGTNICRERTKEPSA